MARISRSREQFAFSYPIQVRWADMDVLGHVNNAHYFTYSESARLAYRDAVFPATPEQQDLILARTSCDFIEQLRYPGDLDAACRIAKLGRTSLVFEVAMFAQGSDTLVALTEAVTVWFDYAAQSPAPVPDGLRQAIVAHEPALATSD